MVDCEFNDMTLSEWNKKWLRDCSEAMRKHVEFYGQITGREVLEYLGVYDGFPGYRPGQEIEDVFATRDLFKHVRWEGEKEVSERDRTEV